MIKEDSIETQNNNSFVYLLLSTDGNKFKIGKADNVHSRYTTLKRHWGEFDLEKSMQIKCDKKQVHNLEKTLHFIFDNYNIELPSNSDGYTEWFDSDCFEDVTDLLKDIAWKMSDNRIQIIEGVKSPYKLQKEKKEQSNKPTLTKEQTKRAEQKHYRKMVNRFKVKDGVMQKLMDNEHSNSRPEWRLTKEEYNEYHMIYKMRNDKLEERPLFDKWVRKYAYM